MGTGSFILIVELKVHGDRGNAVFLACDQKSRQWSNPAFYNIAKEHHFFEAPSAGLCSNGDSFLSL